MLSKIYRVLSMFLLIGVFSIWFCAACLTDVLMKGLYGINQERMARNALYTLSQLTQGLLYLWGTKIECQSASLPNSHETISPSSMKVANADFHSKDNDQPILFVVSHHSSLDIMLLTNQLQHLIGLRQIGFISRSGLNRGIPAISQYLRRYGYSLPRRKRHQNGKALPAFTRDNAMARFARQADQQGNAVVIFPEGMKPVDSPEQCLTFHRNGLRILLNNMPNALIVPVVIAGTGTFYTTPRCWQDMLRRVPRFNQHIKIKPLPPLATAQHIDVEQTIDQLQQQIFTHYQQLTKTKPLSRKQRVFRGINPWIQ